MQAVAFFNYLSFLSKSHLPSYLFVEYSNLVQPVPLKDDQPDSPGVPVQD